MKVNCCVGLLWSYGVIIIRGGLNCGLEQDFSYKCPQNIYLELMWTFCIGEKGKKLWWAIIIIMAPWQSPMPMTSQSTTDNDYRI